MFYEFVKETKGCLSNFSDDGSWPSVIDEFIFKPINIEEIP